MLSRTWPLNNRGGQGASEPVADAVAASEGADALLVQEDGKPVGVVTRQACSRT